MHWLLSYLMLANNTQFCMVNTLYVFIVIFLPAFFLIFFPAITLCVITAFFANTWRVFEWFRTLSVRFILRRQIGIHAFCNWRQRVDAFLIDSRSLMAELFAPPNLPSFALAYVTGLQWHHAKKSPVTRQNDWFEWCCPLVCIHFIYLVITDKNVTLMS